MQNREKQIEEMAKLICSTCQRELDPCGSEKPCRSAIAECNDLYNAGYRKASEVAEEIADFIWEKDIAGTLLPINGRYLSKQEFLSELKKKYTEDGE